MTVLGRRQGMVVFAVLAFAYFLSTLIRAITATISPALSVEFGLNARDLGLLGGGYFLGFAITQLPLGHWLDRFGPRTVEVAFLAIAVAGCIGFAQASSFSGLLTARILCGIGVSACLMAPLTGYRRWLEPVYQLRSGSWMLMVGSLGMVASTLPVQWLLPQVGWRPIFSGLALAVVLSIVAIAWLLPSWEGSRAPQTRPAPAAARGAYAQVWQNPYFQKLVPVGFFGYGGMLAIQTLWAGPWMTRVAGHTPAEAATGLFWINVCMLLTYWLWGWANPWLARKGYATDRQIAVGMPISMALLAILIIAGSQASTWAAVILVLYCVCSTTLTQALTGMGLAFQPELAGRALTAFNLVVFCGVFSVQWGLGLAIDGLRAWGWPEVQAYQGAMGLYALCCLGAYGYFWLRGGTKHLAPRQ